MSQLVLLVFMTAQDGEACTTLPPEPAMPCRWDFQCPSGKCFKDREQIPCSECGNPPSVYPPICWWDFQCPTGRCLLPEYIYKLKNTALQDFTVNRMARSKMVIALQRLQTDAKCNAADMAGASHHKSVGRIKTAAMLALPATTTHGGVPECVNTLIQIHLLPFFANNN